MATKNETEVIINMEEMRRKVMMVRIVGDTSLIVHRWAEKAKKEILEKQQKKASKGREVRVPAKEFVAALYLLDNDGNEVIIPEETLDTITTDTPMEEVVKIYDGYGFGFPSSALKASMVDTAYQQGLVPKKTTIRGAIRVEGEFLRIQGSSPVMREDMVKLSGPSNPSDLRYRPEFKTWYSDVVISYLENSVSPEQIVQFINYAGFCSGLGEWRPSRDGQHGTFHAELLH